MELRSTKKVSKEEQSFLVETALGMGFNDIKFIPTKSLINSEKNFLKWREKGFAADMGYLLRDNPINARPSELFHDAKSIIMLTVNYYSPVPKRPSGDYGRIANYAVGLDYHKVIKKKLRELVKKVDGDSQLFRNSKLFTDSVPLLEKSFAKQAGLGFRGKNTLLISRDKGSFNFILEIITDLEFDYDADLSEESSQENISIPPNGHCGACTRCSDICPTNAIVDNYQLDARLCISYLTIENRGKIAQELHSKIGEWLFGCDLCQDVCPYNIKAERNGVISGFDEFKPESGFGHWLHLAEILSLDSCIDPNQNDEFFDNAFHEKFCHTPLTRPKRIGMIRNAMIVASNSQAEESLKLVEKYIQHENEVLRETALAVIL